MSFIQMHDVIKIYEEPRTGLQIPALRGVELSIKEGELVCIIGPSGSGKSTLLKLLGGLDKPSSGSIIVAGNRVDKMDEELLTEYRRYKVGFLWQFPERNLLPILTALENIELPMKIAGFPRQQRRRRALELLDRIGLRDRSSHRLHQLSGGEAQRVSLAVALANDPQVVLCDEPTGELDTKSTMEIISFMRELNQEYNKTIVVVTHDMRFEQRSDRAFRILDGMISGVRQAIKNETTGGSMAGSIDAPLEREELIYVDQFGNIRIPKHFLLEAGIKNYVRIHVEGDKLVITKADD